MLRGATPLRSGRLLVIQFPGELGLRGKAPSLGSMVDIRDAFSRLFKGRKVDVATHSILNNPYRKQHIEKDLEELYAA